MDRRASKLYTVVLVVALLAIALTVLAASLRATEGGEHEEHDAGPAPDHSNEGPEGQPAAGGEEADEDHSH